MSEIEDKSDSRSYPELQEELRLWTPRDIPYAPYDGDPEGYMSKIREAYGAIVNDYGVTLDIHTHNSEPWLDAGDWFTQNRQQFRKLIPVSGTPFLPLARGFRSQLADALMVTAKVPELESRLRFKRAWESIARTAVANDFAERNRPEAPLRLRDLGAAALQEIQTQIANVNIEAIVQPLPTMRKQQEQEIIQTIGSELLNFWGMSDVHDLPVVSSAKLPTLRPEYQNLARIFEASSNRRNVMRLYISDQEAYRKLAGKADHYQNAAPENVEPAAATLAVGEQLCLYEGDLAPRDQLVRIFDDISKAIAVDIYSAHDLPELMRTSRWETVNGDVVAKLTKNFNGKVTNVKIERLPLDADTLEKVFKGIEPPDSISDGRRYILTADLKSSGRPALPSGIEFVIYYRKNLMFRLARKPASGQKAVDAMIAEATENARIIKIENIEKAGSAGAPGTGKRR